MYVIAPPEGSETSLCMLMEVNMFKAPRASMFVGQEVHKDGGLYMVTPVDPLFNLIPLFEENEAGDGGCFVPLEDLVTMRFGEGKWEFGNTIDQVQLENICEVKLIGNDRYYRLSDSKVMRWLQQKISGVTSKQTIMYSLQLVCEYLPSKRAAKLKHSITLDLATPMEEPTGAAHQTTPVDPARTEMSAKRQLNTTTGPVDDYTVFNKPAEKKSKAPTNSKHKKRVEGQTLLSFGLGAKKKPEKIKRTLNF